MTGAGHYREAERLRRLALEHYEDEHPTLAALTMQQAQVSAILALTAATVQPHASTEWQEAIA